MDRLEVRDYEWDLIIGDASKKYNNASIEEMLGFASKGTEISLGILEDNRTRDGTWGKDREIADSVKKRVQRSLISDRETKWGLHFVGNSTFIVIGIRIILRRILDQQICGGGSGIFGISI